MCDTSAQANIIFDSLTIGLSGIISSVIPDGIGGFFIGGNFIAASGKKNLIHLDINKIEYPNFNPSPEGYSYYEIVSALHLINDTLYVGGDFYKVANNTINYLAALNASTGLAYNFMPLVDGAVKDLKQVGDTLYFGGQFSHINNTSQVGIGAIKISTGQLIPMPVSVAGNVYKIFYNPSDNRIYMCGNIIKQTGEWTMGKPNGKGTYFAPDGQKKEGIWRMGEFLRPEPLPASSSASNVIAKTGCISGDCQNGQGVYLFPGGAIYIGQFSKGEISSAGICYYLDGSRYQGEWTYGYPEGRGAKYFPDGKKWAGAWKRGLPVGENGAVLSESAISRHLSHSYTVQSGCIRGNCENGKGLVVYPDGSRYEGDFLQHWQALEADLT